MVKALPGVALLAHHRLSIAIVGPLSSWLFKPAMHSKFSVDISIRSRRGFLKWTVIWSLSLRHQGSVALVRNVLCGRAAWFLSATFGRTYECIIIG